MPRQARKTSGTGIYHVMLRGINRQENRSENRLIYSQDHLGNNRAVMNHNGTVEQITHYYPFGAIFSDAGSHDETQRYKYNGKELDRMHGLNRYDYGARNYDPLLCRFTQMDPLCEKYYGINPYV